ncbi:MAG: caspase family protein [Myxococcota bacterium]
MHTRAIASTSTCASPAGIRRGVGPLRRRRGLRHPPERRQRRRRGRRRPRPGAAPGRLAEAIELDAVGAGESLVAIACDTPRRLADLGFSDAAARDAGCATRLITLRKAPARRPRRAGIRARRVAGAQRRSRWPPTRTPRRFALVIGTNEGAPDEPVLQFAERDAQRMAEVLQRQGGIAAEDIVLLQAPRAADVARALDALKTRMRGDEPSLLVFYYSGHADRTAFHLAHSTYAFAALKAAVRATAAELTIILVDACRAGGLISAKGARVVSAEPLGLAALDDGGPDPTTGLAILASSSQDEDAQESDRLRGGVFTHQLLGGLQGAADDSGDGAVTLTELRTYAYQQTLDFTASTEVVQHPAFAFDLAGHADPVMSWMDRETRGQLVFASPGHYVVSELGGEHQIVTELRVATRAAMALRPGAYRVRRLTSDTAAEGAVDVQAGGHAEVLADSLVPIPFRHAVRKGYGLAHRAAWSLGADAELAAPIFDDSGPLASGAVTAELDVADLALEGRLRYAHGSAGSAFVALEHHLVGVDLGAYHLFDVGHHGVGFGVRVGVDWLHQSIDTYGAAPVVDAVVPRVGSFARLELALGASVALTFDVGLDIYMVELSDGLSAHAAPTFGVGLAFRVP